MQYRAFEPGIEISGAGIRSMFGGFGPLRAIVYRILCRDGLIDPESADAHIDTDAWLDTWYDQQAWLDALREVDLEYGAEVLFNIGAEIPNTALFPASPVDVYSAVASIDVAYHLNHRRGGQVMIDPATGVMVEGIGHYGCERVGERQILSTCVTPYPCEFDFGIVATMARRFEPRTIAEHLGECRRHGAMACTYSLRWG